MDDIDIRVELPAYSLSFSVRVPASGTVLDVKRAIAGTCTGQPRVEGQRIIWRGRALGDEEKVINLWKASVAPHIVHLAVHPSAWSASPPEINIPSTSLPMPSPRPLQQTAPTATLVSAQPPTRSEPVLVTPTVPPAIPPVLRGTNLQGVEAILGLTPPYALPSLMAHYIAPTLTYPPSLQYIVIYHKDAITALVKGQAPIPYAPGILDDAKASAKELVTSHGYAWPDILDQSFPLSDPSVEHGDGLVYETTHINGKPYLSLKEPRARPKPVQIFALKVLTHTFPLLALRPQVLPDPSRLIPSVTRAELPPNVRRIQVPVDLNQVPLPPDVNNLLQELGLPPMRLANRPNPNANVPGILADLRRVPLRPLFAPLLMLLFRTVLLLYFVAPARKPVFAALLLAWVFYECWQAVRNTISRGLRREGAVAPGGNANANPGAGAGAAGPQQGVDNAAQAGMNAAAGQAAVPGQPHPRPGGNGFDQRLGSLLDTLSTMNIQAEELALNGVAPVEPGVSHKLTTFFALFAATLHPAAWNRRRAALRQREGRVRMEASVRRQDERHESEGDSNSVEGLENRAFNERRRMLIDEHVRRPKWVRDYVERVLSEEWVDDAD